jgi:hypothetical protein
MGLTELSEATELLVSDSARRPESLRSDSAPPAG